MKRGRRKITLALLITGLLVLSTVIFAAPAMSVTEDGGGCLPDGGLGLVLKPNPATVCAGEGVTYRAYLCGEEVTDCTDFSIQDEAGGSWENNVYTSENVSPPEGWTVTGTLGECDCGCCGCHNGCGDGDGGCGSSDCHNDGCQGCCGLTGTAVLHVISPEIKLTLTPETAENQLPDEVSHEFTATVTYCGEKPIEGALVHFETDFGEFGSLGSESQHEVVETDANGRASVIIYSDTAGIAHITASVYEEYAVDIEIIIEPELLASDTSTKTWHAPPAPAPGPAVVIVAGTTNALSLGKSVDKASASPGEVLTYIMSYSNVGNTTLTGVVLTDQIPAGTTYVDGSATAGGIYDAATGTLTWNIGTLEPGDPGEGGSVTFQVTINADATGTVTNTAYLKSAEIPDPLSASASTAVEAVAVLAAVEELPYTGSLRHLMLAMLLIGAGLALQLVPERKKK